MNIQEILNNNTIKTNDILKLATDPVLMNSTISELYKNYEIFSEMKCLFEDKLEDTHNYQDIRSEYIRAKKYKRINAEKFDSPDYSLKTYLNWRFSTDFYDTYDISIDSFCANHLYYIEEDDISLLDLDYCIGYNIPDDYTSVQEMIHYFRDGFEEAIHKLNDAIEHTIKAKDILDKLTTIIKNSPNIVSILRMAAM